MSAKVFLEILSGLRKAAPQVDLGDMARQVSVSPRVAAVEKMVQKAPGADWGWKGGKPGEITGGMYNELQGKMSTSGGLQSTNGLSKSTLKRLEESPITEDLTTGFGLVNAANKQLRKTPAFRRRIEANIESVWETMKDFQILENAQIPRKWTGKVAQALPPLKDWQTLKPFKEFFGLNEAFYPYDHEAAARALSDTMRPMTNAQRETFLQLLPRWSGTLETAASAAKKLYKR